MSAGERDTDPGKRTVIFVGGTAYSGSTLLDMILANDPHGHSCGEINAAVHPYLDYHENPTCGCGDADCEVWQDIREFSGGAHERVFPRLDSAHYLVDSSKDIPWIKTNAERLKAAGYEVRHVLIWKTPAEYYQSRKKRGEEKGWIRSWINYHRAYMSLIHPFVAVRYSDFVQKKRTLRALCESLGLDYFEGKERYWDKTQHTLFGNSSAKIHLHSEDSEDFQKMSSELDKQDAAPAERPRKQLYYDADAEDLPENLSNIHKNDFTEIVEALSRHAPDACERQPVPWGMAPAYLLATGAKHWFRSWRHDRGTRKNER